MAMTKSFSTATSVSIPIRIEERIVQKATTSAPVYNRILVILSACTNNEHVLHQVAKLAEKHHANIVMISEDTTGNAAYIERTCRALMAQNIQAHGYTIGTDINHIPAWLLKNEQADVVIVGQRQSGWLRRLFGQNIATYIRHCTGADVIEVGI